MISFWAYIKLIEEVLFFIFPEEFVLSPVLSQAG